MKKKLALHISWACFSLAFITMYTIAALSYINAIFLTTYPTSYLAYFYLAFAILFICTSQLTGTHLTHHYKKTLTVMLFICIFLLLGNWHFSTHFQIGSWWPFFFCTFLMMSNKFLMHNYWNGISQLLEIRDFKHYSNYFSGSSALAGVMMGYFLPYFIKGHSIFILLPIMAAFLTINLILLQLIKIEEAVEEDAPSGKSFTYQYKLQKLLFPFLICTLVFSTLVDYIFKYQIKLSLDSTQIAIYTSEMTALSNIIVFCMQLFFTRMVLKRFGLFGFILQVPILLTVLILLVLSHPSLMTITILMVGYNVINFSILDVSFQLLGNALPTHVRIMTKLHLRGMTLFLGALISAGLITLLANQATPTIIALFLLAVAGAFALLAKWISMAYNDTLENDLEKHHIIHNEDSYLTENIRYWHELIDKCFSSEEDAVRLMGYELLAEKKYPITLDILEKVVLDLKTQNPIIRIEAIKQLQQHMNKKMFKVLKKRLLTEVDREVIWWIFQAFSAWHKNDVIAIAQEYLNSADELLQAGSISILIKVGNIVDVALALNRLIIMINSPDPKARITAARILSLFELHGAVESLSTLIMDKNVEVSITAIQSVMVHPNDEYIPALIHQMGVKSVTYYAVKAILSYGESTISVLMKKINKLHNPVFHRAAIRCIASIKGKKAEAALTELLKHDDSHVRNNTTKAIAYRSMTIEMSRDFYKAIRKRIEVEEDHITYYQQLLQLQLTYFERQETKALIYGAIYRVLYLFSIDDADKMMPLIPLILESVSEEEFSGFFQKELELLDNYLRHSKDRSFLSHLFEEPKLTIPPEVLLSKQKMGPWLTQVFSAKILTHQGVAMHDLEKLVVLRGCNLFKTLSADILLVLANRMQVELIAKDTILFTEGDISGDLYIIAEGNIVISHSGQIIGYKEKFDFVGELSLLDDKPRTATAAAMTDAVVLKMAKIEYDRILDDFPDLLRTIVQTLLGYLRKVQPLAVQK